MDRIRSCSCDIGMLRNRESEREREKREKIGNEKNKVLVCYFLYIIMVWFVSGKEKKMVNRI